MMRLAPGLKILKAFRVGVDIHAFSAQIADHCKPVFFGNLNREQRGGRDCGHDGNPQADSLRKAIAAVTDK